MAVTIDPDAGVHTVMVHFTVEPGRREVLVEAIGTFVEDVVRHQPGFVSSTVHISLDGTRVINYAQWASREAFEAFQNNPEAMSRQGVIPEFQPSGQPYTIAFQAAAAA
ncbi:antibiotic biosynthesis monooxygenase family protein [Streptomyces sp. NPDC088810]|uniref:antibiotic biosynthesis monooxygenase family protein n=1 Tax=Streptomyces sp. NPDC088810 TaxID=3365904 RepID=UPI0038275CE1